MGGSDERGGTGEVGVCGATMGEAGAGVVVVVVVSLLLEAAGKSGLVLCWK
jgi:hypothetical protein